MKYLPFAVIAIVIMALAYQDYQLTKKVDTLNKQVLSVGQALGFSGIVSVDDKGQPTFHKVVLKEELEPQTTVNTP